MENTFDFSSMIKRYAWQEVCRKNGNTFNARDRCVAVPSEKAMKPEEQVSFFDLVAMLTPEIKEKVNSAIEQSVPIGTDLFFRSRFVRGLLILRWEGKF